MLTVLQLLAMHTQYALWFDKDNSGPSTHRDAKHDVISPENLKGNQSLLVDVQCITMGAPAQECHTRHQI